jgi:hypothetical protein
METREPELYELQFKYGMQGASFEKGERSFQYNKF